MESIMDLFISVKSSELSEFSAEKYELRFSKDRVDFKLSYFSLSSSIRSSSGNVSSLNIVWMTWNWIYIEFNLF